jgi:hypothetical protein
MEVLMTLTALSQGCIKRGTFFWAANTGMAAHSQIKSGTVRPYLVLNVVDNTAICCPLSSTSDAWNAQVSPHYIPYDFNPEFFGFKDALIAVNRVVVDGYTKFDTAYIETLDRIDLPQQFVVMANQLAHKFASDKRARLIPASHSRSKFKESRVTQSIKRVELTTQDIMSQLYPGLTGF